MNLCGADATSRVQAFLRPGVKPAGAATESPRCMSKHWYEVATACDSTMKIYFDPRPCGERMSPSWWLLFVEGADGRYTPKVGGEKDGFDYFFRVKGSRFTSIRFVTIPSFFSLGILLIMHSILRAKDREPIFFL